MTSGDLTAGRRNPDVPLLPAPLIGRRAEIEAARDLLLSGARLLTLTGPPGVGKTSLALALAAELLDRCADGAALIDLAAITNADLVAATIAETLGVAGRRQPIGRLIGTLRRREMLLVLDNFEQVVEAAPIVAELLAGCPRLAIVVTSRIPLRLRWEHELPVPPLQLPAARDPMTAESLLRAPAIRLFVERARGVNPMFALTDANARDIVNVCARLDGLPLAIELAAARARLLTPAAMLRQLGGGREAGGAGRALGLLADGPRDLPPRQQTLRDAIAWSHALLNPAEQRLFRRLAVFAGGCTLEAAERVCEASWTDVASLVEKSLLRQGGAPAGGVSDAEPEPRVRMLEMVREYALEQLHASDEEEAIEQRHIHCYVDLAEEAAPGLSGTSLHFWLSRLVAERDNFLAATRRAMRAGDVESVLRLNAALSGFWIIRGVPADAQERIQDLLALALSVGPRPAAVQAFAGVSDLARVVGDYSAAQALVEQSLVVARQLDDRLGMAEALRRLAVLAGYRGNYAEADRAGSESLTILEECGGLASLASTLRELGMISYLADDQARARQLLERSMATAQQVGDLRRIGDAAFSLALTYHVTGEIDRAWQLYEEALRIDRLHGNRGAEGSVLNNLGSLATLRGDVQQARTLLRDSLAASRDGGDRRRLAFTLSAVAGLVATEGKPELAIRLDAAGRAALEAIDARLAPAMRALYDEQLGPARQALGEADVRAPESAGRSMVLEQAVDDALTWLGETTASADAPLEATDIADLAGVDVDPRTGSSRAPGPIAEERPARGTLTRREREVAVLLAHGRTNREIAQVLVVSERTAGNYVQRVMDRLGLHNRAQVAAWAVAHRLHESPATSD